MTADHSGNERRPFKDDPGEKIEARSVIREGCVGIREVRFVIREGVRRHS
jgi:hypothetical protein